MRIIEAAAEPDEPLVTTMGAGHGTYPQRRSGPPNMAQ
jgi:hypothetical protein